MRFETMPASPLKRVIQQLRTASERDGAGKSDGELLTRFLSHRDNEALAELVHRHAPMVWGVCRRLLNSPHDAEDAFQATFLVLVRKAATIMPRQLVGNWLYGVARQTAMRLRATVAKRGVRERQMMEVPEPVVAEARGDDLLDLLDQELSCLPEKYRVLIVLCDLESKTRIEVARQLAIPEGTVASRLARARGMLAKRLARHGLAVSGGSLAAALSQTVASASVPTSVVTSTIQAASLLVAGQTASVVSAAVIALTEGVVKTMLCSKLKTMVAVVLVTGFLASGATLLTYRNTAAGEVQKKPIVEQPVEPAANLRKEKEKVTAWGKEVNGVQIGIQLGEDRVYNVGETVTLILRLRNNGKNEVPFRDEAEYFQKNPPLITDADNKAVTIKKRSIFGFIKRRSVAPGKEVDLIHLQLALRPVTDREKDVEWTLYGTGKFHVKHEDVPVVGEVRLGSPGMTLTTGTLELEVKEAEKPPQQGLLKPKVEKKVYTPDEVMRAEEQAKGKANDGSKSNMVTVEFKVQAVTKPTEIKVTAEKDSPWALGHSPNDLSLHPQPPKKFEEKQFTAILTSKVVKQLNGVGIQDVGKHLVGRTIRISGRVRQHHYSGDDPPIETHYDLVIEDVSQFETVD